MISEKQYKANRNNSKLGGVKSAYGKAISKYNAQTHGILRQSVADYEKDYFDDILLELEKHYAPQNIIENIIVERIAICYLKLFRAQKAEAEFTRESLNPRITRKTGFLTDFAEDCIEVVNEGYTAKLPNESVQKLMDIYSRYETTLENRLFRAIHELERAQRIRKGEKILAPLVSDISHMGSFGERSGLNE